MEDREIYKILGSEVRRRILVYIGDRGSVRFTEMRRDLKLSVGSLYYHLDLLKGLVTQKSDKSYTLTSGGLEVYRRIKEGGRGGWGVSGGVVRVLLVIPLFEVLNQSVARSLVAIAVSSAVLIMTSLISGLGMFGVYPVENSGQPPTLTVLSSLFGLWILLDTACSTIYGRFGVNHVQFFSQVSIIYLLYYLILSTAAALRMTFPNYLFLAIQAWLALIMGAAVAVSKGVRLERGFMVTLLALYLNTAILMLMGGNM